MKPTQGQLENLWETCKGYIDTQEISCGETVYQSDVVSETGAEFIDLVCQIVGYWEPSEEEKST